MEQYLHLTMCLRGLKGLSEKEARVFFEICNRGSVSVKEVMEIFENINAPIARSSAYIVMERFEKLGLVFQDNAGSKKKYKAVHPRTLLDEIKNSFGNLDAEISTLEQSYETADFECDDPRVASKVLDSEGEIRTLSHLLSRNTNVTVVCNKESSIYEFTASLANGNPVVEGSVNAILFEDEEGKKGVIRLSRRVDKKGNIRPWGQLTYDEDQFQYLQKNEVENEG